MSGAEQAKSESVVCGATILGPRVGRHVIAWRKQCGRKTRHESGRCHDHRTLGVKYGPGGER